MSRPSGLCMQTGPRYWHCRCCRHSPGSGGYIVVVVVAAAAAAELPLLNFLPQLLHDGSALAHHVSHSACSDRQQIFDIFDRLRILGLPLLDDGERIHFFWLWLWLWRLLPGRAASLLGLLLLHFFFYFFRLRLGNHSLGASALLELGFGCGICCRSFLAAALFFGCMMGSTLCEFVSVKSWHFTPLP